MIDPNNYVYRYACTNCGTACVKTVHVNARIMPAYCSTACRNKAYKLRAAGNVVTPPAPKASRDTLAGRLESKRFASLFPGASGQEQPADESFEPDNYRKTGGYKPRKQVTTQRPKTQFDVICPHPYKLAYRTVEEAQAFIDATHPDDAFLAPYKCKCGGTHIGHSYPRNHPLHPANRRTAGGSTR